MDTKDVRSYRNIADKGYLKSGPYVYASEFEKWEELTHRRIDSLYKWQDVLFVWMTVITVLIALVAFASIQ